MKARGIRTLAVVAALALLSGCGDLFSLDARAANACVTVNGLHVPGLNELPTPHTYPPVPVVTIQQAINVPFDASFLPQGSAYTVQLVSFKLESLGTQTLEFIETAKLTTVSGNLSTVVATYTRTSTAPTKAIETAPVPEPDVTAAIVNDVLHLQGAFTGTPPAQGFAAEATVCFDISTNVKTL
ncbi:MAG: hypothetical protein QM765_08095 [Myxococcales bacterium]